MKLRSLVSRNWQQQQRNGNNNNNSYINDDERFRTDQRRWSASLPVLRAASIGLTASNQSFASISIASNHTYYSLISLEKVQKGSVSEAKEEQKTLLFPTAKGLWFHQVVPLRERIQSPITTLLRHARLFGMASALFNTPTTPSGYDTVRTQAGHSSLRSKIKFVPTKNTHRALSYLCTVALYNLNEFRISLCLEQTNRQSRQWDSVPTGMSMDKQKSNT